MRKYSFALSLMALGLLYNACSYDVTTDPYADMSALQVSCEKSGGTFLDTNRCSCSGKVCNAGMSCNADTKQCPINESVYCNEEDTQFCDNSKLLVCKDHKLTPLTDLESDCGTLGCLSDNSGCVECVDGTHCADGSMITCVEGKIINKVACNSNACEDGEACKPNCTDGEFSCKDSKLYICNNDDWQEYKDCPAGCDTTTNNSCASNCNDNDTLCIDGSLKTCQDGVYGEPTPCPNGVSCKADGKTCGICKDGSTECNDGQIKTCENGVWGYPQACKNDASCKDEQSCGECKDGTTKCEDDENQEGTQSTCENGQWGNKTECKTQYGNALSCADNTCGICLNDIDTSCYNDNYGSNTEVGYLIKCKNGIFPELSLKEKNQIPADSDILCQKKDIGYTSCFNNKMCGSCKNNDIAFCAVYDGQAGMYTCEKGAPKHKSTCACCAPDLSCIASQGECNNN